MLIRNVSVIDWDFTFAAPLQKAVTFPKLIENVPGAAPPDIPEQLAYLDFSADKSYFLRILAAKETEKRESTSIAKLMGDSSERNFFEMSLHRAPVHKMSRNSALGLCRMSALRWDSWRIFLPHILTSRPK